MTLSTDAAKNEKPTGMALGLAYAALGFGALGVLSPAFSLGSRGLTRLMNRALANPRLTLLDQIMWSGTFGTWMWISVGLGFVLGLVLLATGFGLLRRRRWASQLGMLYATFQTAMVVANVAFTFVLLVPAMRELSAHSPNDPAARAGDFSGVTGVLIGSVFGLALPVALVVLLRRRDVQAQLTR